MSLTEAQWTILLAVADTFIGPVAHLGTKAPPELLRTLAKADEQAKIITEFLNEVPSASPEYRIALKQTVGYYTPPRIFAQLQSILETLQRNSVIGAISSPYLPWAAFNTLTLEERQKVLQQWSKANSSYRGIYRILFVTTVTPYLRVSTLMHAAIGHPLRDPHLNNEQRFQLKKFFRFEFADAGNVRSFYPRIDDHEWNEREDKGSIEFDAVVIGSGAGGSAAAARIAASGFRVLVVEKGEFFHQEKLTFSEHEGLRNLYDYDGVLYTDNENINIIQGSTFGGSATVAWGAIEQPTTDLLKSWDEISHTRAFNNDRYVQSMEYIARRMGITKAEDYKHHSFANRVLIDGNEAAKGAELYLLSQNTAGYQHRCGYCGLGCRYGEKRSPVVSSLADAAGDGTVFLQNAKATKIDWDPDSKTASSVEVECGGVADRLTVKARHVVMAAGAVHTPGILLRSGFNDYSLGEGLKLSPGVYVFGAWNDKLVDGFDDSILTASLRIKFRATIEPAPVQPVSMFTNYPWLWASNYKLAMLQYRRMAAYTCRVKDSTSGTVRPDGDNIKISYNIAEYDRDCLIDGIEAIARVLYSQGADTIATASNDIPPYARGDGSEEEFEKWIKTVRSKGLRTQSCAYVSHYQSSTCMVGSPYTAAVTAMGVLRSCSNVHIADASVFPTAIKIPPLVSGVLQGSADG